MSLKYTLDKYLNPYIPSSIVNKLPPYLGRWLGQHHSLTGKTKPDYLTALDIMIGTFCGLLTLEGIFKHSQVFIDHHSPILIASYGATAILLFNANQVPLAQPRNILLGQFFSALVGVIILKLFELSETGKDHLYVGAALSTAIASVVMALLNCVHPPSGATALIPLIDPEIGKMGWWYLPVHLVSSVVIIGVGLITNNILRSYPVYFWTAHKKPTPQVIDDEEALKALKTDETRVRQAEEIPKIGGGSQDDDIVYNDDSTIVINLENIYLPQSLKITETEYLALKSLRSKLDEITSTTL